MLRKLSPLFASLLLFLLQGSPAGALDNASCCLSTTSRLDGLMNPVKGSDEKFFAKPGGPPNVVFIVDTSASMQDWPRAWNPAKGCGFLDDLGYEPSRDYPTLWSGVNTQDSNWFNKNLVYAAPNAGYGANFSAAPPGPKWAGSALACADLVVTNGATPQDVLDCVSCLNNKGYYTQAPGVRRATGNFLNFYAPRDSGAIKAMAEVVKDLREVRFSIMSFNAKTSKCWSGGCICMAESMKPSCDKSYPLDGSSWESSRNSILNGISNNNTFEWGGCGTPLQDALYAAGYYLSNKTAPQSFNSLLGTGHPKSNNFDEGNSAGDKSVCFECSFNAIILLTDGEPEAEGSYVTLPSAITGRTVTCPGCTGGSQLHKVADFLWKSDLRTEASMIGVQRAATYTIGFSDTVADSALLKATAKAGGGKFYPARSSSQLKDVILTILDDINARNTTFSSSAITSLQVQTSALTAVVPRMLPSRNDPWAGQLFRFEQYNEFVQENNLNGPGDKDREDLFLTDFNGNVVTENADGDYFKGTFDVTTGATVLTPTPAVPFWEANKKLVDLKHENRNIWTVLDNNSNKVGGTPDGSLTEADGLVPFNMANVTTLMPYLGIGGAPECPDFTDLAGKRGTILEKLGMDVGTAAEQVDMTLAGITSQALADELCARLVIQYLRGQDLADDNTDGNRRDTRLQVLGDIFHSSPVIVDPPADKFLCDLGIVNQCARTLYSTRLGVDHTPLNADASHPRDCTNLGANITRDAYDKYQFMNRKRERLVLVGANDGMLHAFSDGWGDEPNTAPCTVKYDSKHPEGGKERWAFIPPDQLPRLFERMIETHRYYVDGDIMVREVWAGDINPQNGKKDAEEYKVMVVAAEGRGGNHYFALSLDWGTENGVFKEANDRPNFRWMFPQPCSEEAARFGKTLYALSPKAPPIGPVLMESIDSGSVLRYGKTTAETWVAMLSGGWSPAGERGRGVYMVDVWNGKVNNRNDNLLWKWEYNPTASGAKETQKHMTHGFVAPVAMVDYGANDKPRLDGFFDTAIAGDMGGQLWTFRFHEPGQVDSATGLVKNWSGARTFQMDKDGVSLTNPLSVRNRAPIHYLPSIALQPDTRALRAFIGTGDRYAVLDKDSGTCRFDNPTVCSKLGCSDTKVEEVLKLPSGDIKLSNIWGNQRFATAGLQNAPLPASFCGAPNDPDYIVAEFTERSVLNCPKVDNASNKVSYDLAKTKVECGQNATGTFACRVKEPGNLVNMADLAVHPTSTQANLGKNRYYGLWVYGGKASRVFKENALSASTDQTAAAYDGVRLTDTDTSGGTGDLANVTSTTCTSAGVCTGPQGSPRGHGWFLEYEAHSHKTATGSAVIASCVLWNSVFPAASTASACANPAAAKARLFQGDFITGAPNCAAGFNGVRFLARDVVAPPTEPSIITQISKSGAVQVGAMVNDGAGGPQKIPVTVNPDLLQAVYELPVSRALHDCRHVENGECAPIGP